MKCIYQDNIWILDCFPPSALALDLALAALVLELVARAYRQGVAAPGPGVWHEQGPAAVQQLSVPVDEFGPDDCLRVDSAAYCRYVLQEDGFPVIGPYSFRMANGK